MLAFKIVLNVDQTLCYANVHLTVVKVFFTTVSGFSNFTSFRARRKDLFHSFGSEALNSGDKNGAMAHKLVV